jgi:hypothetical protein
VSLGLVVTNEKRNKLLDSSLPQRRRSFFLSSFLFYDSKNEGTMERR